MACMTKRKPRGRARERGETRPFTFEMDLPLDNALEACARQERRTKKAVLTFALEQYLAEQGFWPPAEEK
jgi:hypothetical protein